MINRPLRTPIGQIAALLLTLLVAAPAEAGLRGQCRRMCRAEVARCRAAGQTRQSCRRVKRVLVRECMARGATFCLFEPPTTTTTMIPGATTTTAASTTTTTTTAGPGSTTTTVPGMVMTFFVTSIGSADRPNDAYVGGNFGGALGADAFCTELATTVGAEGRTWKAYVSTLAEAARDRIGPGPWHNALGQMVAAEVASLHANGIAADRALDEYGQAVPSSAHDILTGADASGGLAPFAANCNGFGSSHPDDYVQVGHSDGGGAGQDVTQSWSSAHLTQCDEAGMAATAGRGRLYCFAP